MRNRNTSVTHQKYNGGNRNSGLNSGHNRHSGYGIYYVSNVSSDGNGDILLNVIGLDVNDAPIEYKLRVGDSEHWKRILNAYFGVNNKDGLMARSNSCRPVFIRCYRRRRNKDSLWPVLPDRAVKLVNYVFAQRFCRDSMIGQ